MKKNWYFAFDNGEKDYLSDGAIEIFKNKGDGSDAFRSLAREVIQNSLDAKRDDINGPLVVDFQLIEINQDEFPGLEYLSKHVIGTIDYCKESEKTNIALTNSKKQASILSQKTFTVLKISDYNTKGVSGSDDLSTKKNKWKGLVYNDGDSIKDSGGALGSFGLGKNASFAISSLKTVFYVTRDMNDNYAMEGVAKLYTSYVNGVKYFNEGYFCNEENGKTTPLSEEEAVSISNIFERDDRGTDVIIFEPNIVLIKDKVKWYLIESIISNFFMAFVDGELEVKVCGTEINQNQLYRVFGSLLEYYNKIGEQISQNLICVKQYLETIENGEDFSGELDYYGLISLKLLKTPETKFKNIAIFREGGMLIKDYPVNSASQKFSGVLVVKGKEGNCFLKSIEDPNHRDFDPSRETEDQTLNAAARKSRLNSFYNWIVQNAKNFTHIDSSGSIALSGMEDYIQMPENGEFSKKERKDIQIKKIKRNKKKEKERLFEKKYVEEEENVGLDVPEIPHRHNSKPIPPTPNDYTPDPKSLREDENSNKKGLLKMYGASFIIPPVMQYNETVCTIIFKTTAAANKTLKLKVSAIGEDGNPNTFLPSIIKAIDANSGLEFKVKDGVICGISGDDVTKINIFYESKLNTRVKPFVYWEE